MTAHACPDCGHTHHIPHTAAVCRCGHPESAHHRTPTGRRTLCTVWNPGECLCQAYLEKEQ